MWSEVVFHHINLLINKYMATSIQCMYIHMYILISHTCSLAQSCFTELSRTFSIRSKMINPFASTTDTTPPSRQAKGSRGTSRIGQEKDKARKEEKDWSRARAREAYISWCAAKAAQQCMRSMQGIKTLTGELHNTAATTPLSEKAMRALPDFVLLDLAPPIPVFGKGLEPVPLEQLMPSVQMPQQCSLNWFTVLTYTYKLLQRCLWPSTASSSSSSDWSLHHHSLTPRVFYQSRTLLGFLKAHCSDLWSTATFPAFPRSLMTTPTNALQPSSAAPPTSVELSYLQAGEQELTIVWSSPLLGTCSEDSVLTLFAFNHKGIRTHPPPNLSAAAIEVHTIPISPSLLKEVRTMWQELMEATKAFLEKATVPRPTSRSPAKQKLKLERSQLPPAPLQVRTCAHMHALCLCLCISLYTCASGIFITLPCPSYLKTKVITAVVSLAEAFGQYLTEVSTVAVVMQYVAYVPTHH